MMGINIIVKHHFCCFSNLLNKVIQVEGRKQLGMSFGTGKSPDCRGLTLEEIMRLNFDQMDFSEFYIDLLKRMKLPKTGDIQARAHAALPNIRKYDGNARNKQNNISGWNSNIKDDSWEAEEEKIEEARRRELAKQEDAKRLEEQRQIELAKQEEIKKEQRQAIKTQELQAAKDRYKQAYDNFHFWLFNGQYFLSEMEIYDCIYRSEFVRAEKIVKALEQDIANGNYEHNSETLTNAFNEMKWWLEQKNRIINGGGTWPYEIEPGVYAIGSTYSPYWIIFEDESQIEEYRRGVDQLPKNKRKVAKMLEIVDLKLLIMKTDIKQRKAYGYPSEYNILYNSYIALRSKLDRLTQELHQGNY